MPSSGVTQKGTSMSLALNLHKTGQEEKGSGPGQTQGSQLQNDMALNKRGLCTKGLSTIPISPM